MSRADLELSDTAPVAPRHHDDRSTKPRLSLDRGVGYQHMRNQIASSLFGEPADLLRIGRFTVLEHIGDGGMGSVYAAYDDALDRKIAVKLLHGGASEEARVRMQQEARALARFSHPNIVTVHEVGEHDGQVFLAMEFVRGQSLSRWIHDGDEPRPWREVLAMLRAAGEGLAVAHEAGLVHRDFKPANVVLDDHAVKVLDFGLAFPTEAEPREPTVEPEGSGSSLESFTHDGALVGTPAYMAPEQFDSRPATAASDQFAFCVSLYEALWGRRPFEGKRLEDLMLAVCEGEPMEPPPSPAVPAWVRAIVMRGLARDPAERFESMRALLDALARDPAVTRRRWLLAATVVAVTVGGSFGLAALQRAPAPEPCTELGTVLDSTWGEPRRVRAREGFLASGASHAADTWSRVEPQLGAYAEAWVDASTQACLDHAGGRQSAAIFDLRTICLESRRASLEAAVAQLQQADAGVAEQAIQVVAGLPSVSRCANIEALTATVPPPDDPEVARQVAEVRERLAVSRVREDAGRYEEAVSLAREAVAQAEPLEHAPLLAEAQLRLGAALMETADTEVAEATLGEGLVTALGAAHHEVAIEALARRLFVRAEHLRLPPERTRDDESIVRALQRRDPGDPHLRWLVANNLAVVHYRADDLPGAEALYDEALEHARARGDAGRWDATVVLSNRARDAFDRNDLASAEVEGRRALESAEQLLGPEHPRIPKYIAPVANALMYRGKRAAAEALFERALRIREGAGPLTPRAVDDLYALVGLAMVRRDHERAQALLGRAMGLVEGVDAYRERMVLHLRGDARVDAGQVEAGLADHRRGLGMAQAQSQGAEDLMVALSRVALSEAMVRAKRWDEARDELGRAAAALQGEPADSPWRLPVLLARGRLSLGAQEFEAAQEVLDRALEIQRSIAAEHPEIAQIQRLRGDALRGRGELARARDAYEDAMRRYETEHDADDPDLARVRFALTQVLARCVESEPGCGEAAGDDAELKRRAQTYAEDAAQTFASLGPAFGPELQAVRAWQRDITRP